MGRKHSAANGPGATLLVGAALTSLSVMAAAAGPEGPPAPITPEQIQEMQRQISALNSTVQDQARRINELQTDRDNEWLTAERAAQIRGIVQDVLADSGGRASLAADGATSGYDKGFFIASPDGNFRLKMNGQIVARYAFSRLSTRSLHQLDPGTYQPPVTGPQNGFPGGTEIRGYQGFFGSNQDLQRTARGFEIRQLKLTFSGNVVDPSWTYKFNLDYSQTTSQTGFPNVSSAASQTGVSSTGPTSGNASAGPGTGGALAGLEDAWVRKQVTDELAIKVGQFKSPLLREELVSDTSLLTTERSLVNQFFTAKRTQGVEVTWQNDMFRFIGSFNDGGNNINTGAMIGTNAFAGDFTQYALTGRAEWKIAGAWSQFDDMSSYRGESFAMYVGGGVNWQKGGGDDPPAYANTWTVTPSGTFQNQGGTVVNNGNVGAGALVPITTLQYPNNIPSNADDDVNNITWTADTMVDFGGFTIYGAMVGNIAYNIPAGWVANPSGGFGSNPASPGGPANNVPGNWSAVPSGALLANGQPAPPAAVFIPGYGYGDSPIFSYGAILQGGWFITDDVELYGRYEWYLTVNNGANGYAGNTASFWGFLPGGSSPFANNTVANGSAPGFPGPNKGINSPTDGYIGGQTNPYYDYNLGANPYGAQHNSILTFGANWYPAGVKFKNLRVTGEGSYSVGPVLFQNGIYGQSVNGSDYRNDGGQPGGGQWVGRFQIQFLF